MTSLRIAAFFLALSAHVSAQGSAKQMGVYEVSLRLPAEGLSAGEEMQLEFRITNVAKALPLIRAKIETAIDMPEMAGMPKLTETAHPESVPGDFGIHPTFSHGGTYRLRMNITPPAGDIFEVEFPLYVLDGGARKTVNPRFRLDVASDRKPKSGQPFKLRLIVRERDNNRPFADFEIMHEKRMHLVVVRKDLTGFRHEHPELMQDGSFVLDTAIPEPGEYHLFADVAPRGAGSQLLFAKLKVDGPASVPKPQKGPATTVVKLDPSGPVKTGRTTTVSAILRDSGDGSPVSDLGLYLGAKAHLILIHEDAVTFVHSHPDERQDEPVSTSAVPFLVRLPKPGIYRGWMQFIRSGTLHTVELQVEGMS